MSRAASGGTDHTTPEAIMRLESGWRLLNHATLAVACVCLMVAERPFLPGLMVCLVPLLALMAAAFWVEGRWVLPVWGANILGALIAGGGLWWLAMQMRSPDSWMSQVPLPTSLVPHVAPVLMALLLVKVFRPRGPADFWLLQGMGLMQVALGCVLASEPAFGGLLALYLACALGCLALHYQVRERQSARAGVGGAPPPPGRFLLRFSLRWTPAVLGAALVLFLLTPRLDGPEWDPLVRFGPRRPGPAAQTGLSAEINLNRTGPVEVNDEEAFRVEAADGGGRPRDDLPPGQRWRGVLLDSYENGVWRPHVVRSYPIGPVPRPLPDFGPDQFVLTFTVQPRRAGGLLLADPVQFGPPGRSLPLSPLPGGTRHTQMFFEVGGTVLPTTSDSRHPYRYRQVMAAHPPDRVPARVPGRGPGPDRDVWYQEQLTGQPVRGLSEWTAGLLRRLASGRRYGLTPGVLPAGAGADGGYRLPPGRWEAVARALENYLAGSGDYGYTLERTRLDLHLDPVLDFLTNVRRGHCERFATALALMLRSLGVPTRVVNGYRGCEGQGGGVYLVRHSHAHSWVEALVPRAGGAGFDWLTLDPTPGGGEASDSSLLRWWESGWRGGRELWTDLIVDYDAGRQADLWERVASGAPLGLLVLAGGGALAGGGVWLRRRARGRAGAGPDGLPPGVPFYARLVLLLARYRRLRPAPAQTPWEFAAAAGEALRADPATAGVAALPARVADLFYRVRFGGRPLGADEARALDAELDRLEEVLRAAGPVTSPAAPGTGTGC